MTRLGFNMGISAIFVGLVGSVLAPIVLVGLAAISVGVSLFLLRACRGGAGGRNRTLGARSPARHGGGSATAAQRPLEILRVRNVTLCAIIASLLLGCAAIVNDFPAALSRQDRRLSPLDMGLVMTCWGRPPLRPVSYCRPCPTGWGANPWRCALQAWVRSCRSAVSIGPAGSRGLR